MNKELQIRRRIANIYNKGLDHFASLKEYNDYLEEVEDIVSNLVDGIDVPAIEAKIKAYSESNYDQIIGSRAQKAELTEKALNAERGVVPDKMAEQDAQTSGASGLYAPAVAPGMQQRQPVPVTSNEGDPAHEEEDEEARKAREERASVAGGWSYEFPRKRALHEAFHSIWVN